MGYTTEQLTDTSLVKFTTWISISRAFNHIWHEAGWIYPPYDFWIGFCQLNFYQNFQTFLEVKIEINWDNSETS